jgi:menaquinone-dependent protoporphyrinogen oxidase
MITGEVTTINIEKDEIPDINLFDKVIIGGSIYIGKIQNDISEFCTRNIDVLKNKKIGFFICSMKDGEEGKAQLSNTIPEELLKNAVIKESFGGEFVIKKLSNMERFIIKKVAKITSDASTISEEAINKFAQLMNNL